MNSITISRPQAQRGGQWSGAGQQRGGVQQGGQRAAGGPRSPQEQEQEERPSQGEGGQGGGQAFIRRSRRPVDPFPLPFPPFPSVASPSSLFLHESTLLERVSGVWVLAQTRGVRLALQSAREHHRGFVSSTVFSRPEFPPPLIRFPDRHFAGLPRVCALSIRTSATPGGTRQNDGLETGMKGATAATLAWVSPRVRRRPKGFYAPGAAAAGAEDAEPEPEGGAPKGADDGGGDLLLTSGAGGGGGRRRWYRPPVSTAEPLEAGRVARPPLTPQPDSSPGCLCSAWSSVPLGTWLERSNTGCCARVFF